MRAPVITSETPADFLTESRPTPYDARGCAG